MRSRTLSVFFSLTILLIVSAPVLSDDFSNHFVSAKAGVLNYLEGQPIVSSGLSNPRRIAANTQLTAGDTIETRGNDRLELLLNPGSFLRIGPGSQLRVIGTDYADMKFELMQGTAIIESATFNKKVHGLTLTTPAGAIRCLKEGLYRIDADQDGKVEVGIRKGKMAWVRENQAVEVLSPGKSYTLMSSETGKPQYAKLQKGDLDPLEQWSRRRAEFLVAANSRLTPWSMMGGGFSRAYGYNLRGGWMYNPFFNCYTFLPYDGIFGSPYGFTYGMFYPVRTSGYAGYSRAGSGSGSQNASNSPVKNTTADQRTEVRTAPSAPSTRGDLGRGEQGNRGGSYGRMRSR